MATLIIEHAVENYDNWRTVYDGHADARASHNITNARIFCDPNDRNSIVGIFEGSASDIDGFLNDPNLKSAMMEAGVVGAPTFTVLDAVTAVA